ncbi:MAG: hypothetical protein DI535_26135 [Citrobacter freundii]|nr:MAG: hypothetical protein DI535_26135 [Citrobacter freundii]
MYNNHRFVYIFCIAFVLHACSAANGKVKNSKDFDKFPVVSVQTETKLLETGLPTPELMLIYRDSLLLVRNNLNRNPYHVRVFDIARQKSVRDILPVSRKQGGALSFMSFNITDSLVWIFDVAKNGFIVANIDSVLASDKGVESYTEYRLKPQIFYYDALLLDRNEALLSGNYDTEEKLVYVNFPDSSRKKVLLSYQQDSTIGTSRLNKMAYESFMLMRPDKKKIVLASRYADQFELLELADGKSRKIRGPVGFSPELEPFENNAGVTVATPGQHTRYGFLKGHVTEQFVYLLFSGYDVKSPHRFYGNRIFVYDWEGNPVKEITLKNDIIDFAVSSDNKMLYTLNPLTKAISSAELK